jgi:RNA polymerase sigma-70 factor, ECF subfamily
LANIISGVFMTSDFASNLQSDLSALPDEVLLQRYVEGQKPAFAELVRRYERELYHFLVRFLGDRAAAEDTFQEAFLQVHESAATFDTSRRFRPWLFTIAANKARDLLRSRHRHPASALDAHPDGMNGEGQYVDLLQASGALPDEPLEKVELQALVHRTIQELPPNLREVLLLGYFHEFPYKQISEMLHIPVGTVKSRLHSAVAHFAQRWNQVRRNDRF